MKKRTMAKLIFGACEVLAFLWGIGFTWFGINGLNYLDNLAVRSIAESYGYSGQFGNMLFYALCITAGMVAIVGTGIGVWIFSLAMKIHTFSDEE